MIPALKKKKKNGVREQCNVFLKASERAFQKQVEKPTEAALSS